MKVGVATDLGLQRHTNEDRVLAEEGSGVFLVVDGIGGHAAGEMAAETAVRVISERLGADGKDRSSAPPAPSSTEDRVQVAITAANNEIFQLAQTNEQFRGMACVLTLVLVENGRVVVGHVGDSRLYLMANGKLRKITYDHSPVGECEDHGEITEKEAMSDPRRNQVFRDVGSRLRESGDRDFIEIHRFRFRTSAALLLCSDGLSDAVPSAEIADIINRYDGDPELVSRRLVDAANSAGGKDNVSVIFVAGDDFDAAASFAARKRHAITRLRENHWRTALNRAIWLSGGICMGTALWAFWDRALPERNAAPEAHRIVVSSSDPRLIAKTLSVAQPGDTLEVAPGEYLGPIELRDEINLISQKPGGAVIRADPAAVADAGIAVAARGLHHSRLSGFRITGGANSPLATGILVDGSNLEIDNVDISGASDCAIRIIARATPLIRTSNLHENAGCGFWIGSGSMPRLEGNRLAGNGVPVAGPGASDVAGEAAP